jgi:hypothetical protein
MQIALIQDREPISTRCRYVIFFHVFFLILCRYDISSSLYVCSHMSTSPQLQSQPPECTPTISAFALMSRFSHQVCNFFAWFLFRHDISPFCCVYAGSCNFSRIDNATLVVTTKAASVAITDPGNAITSEDVTYANAEGNLTSLLVFAESYNVLRILSGMGGFTTCRSEKHHAENMHSLFSGKSFRPMPLRVRC